MASKPFGKNVNRRLANWIKGIIAEALDCVANRRGYVIVLVNAADRSQIDSRSGCLGSKRQGDRFDCFDAIR
jgi:hypothetical protein